MEERARATERREALEAEDVEQMVAARNARRRARGQREESLEEVEIRLWTTSASSAAATRHI